MECGAALRAPIFEGLAERYPNLHSSRRSADASVVLRGKFPITHAGREIDRFFVEIEIPCNFPNAWPRVWETGGRIPHTLARHVNQADGTLCVVLPDEAFIRYPPTVTALEYLNGPLRNFFIGQLCVENGGPWPWGEHAHGLNGAIAYYGDLLGVGDDVLTIGKILYLVCERRYKGHWRCPCESGQIIRKCHGPTMRLIGERVPEGQLKTALAGIAAIIDPQSRLIQNGEPGHS
jgi:hypothetical protein